MKQFVLLTTPFMCMGAAALNADAHEHSMAEGLVVQQTTGQQNGQKQGSSSEMPMRQVTPEAEPKVTHWADPFITAEFIYWRAVEDGMAYAYGGQTRTQATAHSGKVHKPDFDFEPGFKLGFGLKFGHDGWDLYANWTWLSEFESHKHAHSKTNSVLATSWLVSDIFDNGDFDTTSFTVNSASNHWNMKFNALDVELGRNFYISRYLTLRPHFGLKFGWIDQDNEVEYKNMFGISGVSEYKIHQDQDFFGVGIRTGLDTVWYFAKHWGLYGDFAISALWSDFDSSRKDSLSQSGAPKYHTLKVKDDFNTMTEVLELGIGLRYDTTFFLGDYEFYIQAGWEEQIWFNQNQFFDLSQNNNDNLSFQGLTVKAALMF